MTILLGQRGSLFDRGVKSGSDSGVRPENFIRRVVGIKTEGQVDMPGLGLRIRHDLLLARM